MKREVDFLIEGMRLQFVGQELEAKGEVYEEMKTNFTNGDFLMDEWTRKVLLRGSLYEHTAGGTMEGLLGSKYEDALGYHEKYV